MTSKKPISKKDVSLTKSSGSLLTKRKTAVIIKVDEYNYNLNLIKNNDLLTKYIFFIYKSEEIIINIKRYAIYLACNHPMIFKSLINEDIDINISLSKIPNEI